MQSNLEAGASRLVAVPKPRGGLLVVGETGVCYVKLPGQQQKRVAMAATAITVRVHARTLSPSLTPLTPPSATLIWGCSGQAQPAGADPGLVSHAQSC